jgi:hypothetical protein
MYRLLLGFQRCVRDHRDGVHRLLENDGFWYGGGLLDVTVPFLVARDDRKPWIEQKAGKPVFVPDHTRR